MTPFLALACLSSWSQLSGGSAGALQGEESVLASYDLRSVLPRWDAGTSWNQSLLVPPVSSPRQELASVFGSLKYGELAAFELLDLLSQVLGDDLRREGRELTVDGNVLTVLAPSPLQEQVRSVLESLSGALAGTASVRVDVLSLGEAAGELGSAGVITEEEAAKWVTTLVGRGAKHQSLTVELSAGRTAVLDSHRSIPFLFDYDVEIAQNMCVFEPVMWETRDGTRLVLRGSGVPGGLVLSSVCVRSELIGPLAALDLAMSGLVNQGEGQGAQRLAGPEGVQSPELLVTSFAFDTFLADGKALALTLEGSLGEVRRREVVLIRRAGGGLASFVARPVPRTSRTLIALDTGLFRPARLACSAEPWVDPRGGVQPSVVASLEAELSGFLLEWLKARFSVWRRFGPWILIVTDPAWDRDAAAQLERLVKSLRPATTLRTVGIDLRAPGAGSPVRIRVPLLEGTSAGLVLARGRTAVLGYGVEVAQGSAAPDPMVDSVFDGLALALALQGTTLSARGMAQVLAADVPVLDPRYDVIGPIHRPESLELRFDERLTLVEGRPGPVRIGGSAERADPDGLVLELTVTGAVR